MNKHRGSIMPFDPLTAFQCSNTAENREHLRKLKKDPRYSDYTIPKKDLERWYEADKLTVQCKTNEDMKVIKTELMRRSSRF